MNLTLDLQEYLSRTLGQDLELRESPAARGLPLYLSHAYLLLETRLFGRELLLAVATDPRHEASPSRLAADVEGLRRVAADSHVSLVLPHLASHQRSRLIAAGIPFIVPGRQIFLPTILLDLREHFPRPRGARPEQLTAASQLVLLRHILWHDVEDRKLADVASLCGYSAMTLSNVRDELVAAGLCEARNLGRAKALRFKGDRRTLWKVAQPILRTPVKSVLPVESITEGVHLLDAGLTALARETMIASSDARTVALEARALRRALQENAIVAYPSEDGARILVESWTYDPRRLAAADADAVDPVSLWLSLRDDPDERVQAALEELMEKVSW